MMTKNNIIDIYLKKGILSNKTGIKIVRPFCWKKRFDENAQNIWDSYCVNYRSNEEAWFCLINQVEPPICPICHKNICKFILPESGGKRRYNLTCENCSANKIQSKIDKCKETVSNKSLEEKKKSIELRKKTCLEKYGTENYMVYGSKEFKELMMERYNDPYYSNKDKCIQTCLVKYGYKSNLCIPEILAKNIELSHSSESLEKKKKTCLNKYGVEYITQYPDAIKKSVLKKHNHIHDIEVQNNCTSRISLIKQYGQGFLSLHLEYLKIDGYVFVKNEDISKIIQYKNEGYHTNKYVSKLEKDLLQYVRSIYNGTIIENDSCTIDNGNYRFYELDIYLPEIHLALDFNGQYWHSIKFKDKNYHKRKTSACRKHNVQLIHVFEDQWNNNRNHILDIIKKCIDGSFDNVEKILDDGIYVGNNNYPVLGNNINIIDITEPELVCINDQLSYYDSGKIYYERKRE